MTAPPSSSTGGTPSPVRYDVDPSQVRALAAGLRRIHESILGLGRVDVGTGSDLGSTLVAEGLHELGRGWSLARARLGQELDLLARAGEVAAQSYAAVDGNVLGALR